MKSPTNGTWKTLAVLVLAAFQGLGFWTLSEIKTDIRSIQEDHKEVTRQLGKVDTQLAVIAARHVGEDSTAPPKKPHTP